MNVYLMLFVAWILIMLRLLLMRLLVTFQEDKRYRFCTRRIDLLEESESCAETFFKRWLISYGTSENFEKTKTGAKKECME